MDYLYDFALTDDGDVVVPTIDVRRHLAALRIRDGQTLTLFNGRGLRAFCTLLGATTDGVLRVDSREYDKAPSPLTLAMGLLDSRDRFEFAVEKATELGVTSIVLLDSDHASRLRATSVRLQAKVVAACEQSGRLWLPVVTGPMSVQDFLASTSASILLIGDQQGMQPQALPHAHIAVVVGPEGGFSQREQALFTADQRIQRWTIGRQRLRAETAAIAMVSAVCALTA